jgi:hypothetical protein
MSTTIKAIRRRALDEAYAKLSLLARKAVQDNGGTRDRWSLAYAECAEEVRKLRDGTPEPWEDWGGNVAPTRADLDAVLDNPSK